MRSYTCHSESKSLASANWAICFLSSNVKRLARQLTVCRSEFAWASSKFGDTHAAIALPNATIATPVMTHRIVLIFSSDWALAALNRRFYNAFEKFLPEPCNRRSSDGRRFPAARRCADPNGLQLRFP